jgi:hypothetical protein
MYSFCVLSATLGRGTGKPEPLEPTSHDLALPTDSHDDGSAGRHCTSEWKMFLEFRSPHPLTL